MRKVLSLVVIFLILCSCGKVDENKDSAPKESGVWLTVYELDSMLKSEQGFEGEFDKVIKNCQNFKIQNLYVHTRAFGDCLYESQYFPMMKSAAKYKYDVFDMIISKCKSKGIKVHAWINPYRIITGNENVQQLDKMSPAFRWIYDDDTENDSNVCFANGIYLNPASAQVRRLIIDSIRELLEKYDVDGVHFDDYFYPTTSKDFDADLYEEYKKSAHSPLELGEWRRENVNLLVSGCHTVIKNTKKDVIFSISPAADIIKNRNNLYADIEGFIKNGYVDEIIPQLYFGFEYPDKEFSFEILLKKWIAITRKTSAVKLKIGLGCYKAIPDFEADKSEWNDNDDIIARQMEICDADSFVSGYVFFSYSSLVSQKEAFVRQRQKILDYLNKGV